MPRYGQIKRHLSYLVCGTGKTWIVTADSKFNSVEKSFVRLSDEAGCCRLDGRIDGRDIMLSRNQEVGALDDTIRIDMVIMNQHTSWRLNMGNSRTRRG